VRVAACVAVAGLLASCAAAPTPPSTKEGFSSAEMGVPGSPRVVAWGKPVPKGGGRYLVGKPYRVAGRKYVPRHDADYTATGLASWYGSAFHGRKTANGEVYDVAALSAAHPTMPLPSYARVTNIKNGRSIVVRVNDRGPFKRNRVIDVSESVAKILDFKRAGTARVKVEYVGPAQMDGRDRNMLLATYAEPGKRPAGNVMVASAPAAAPQPKKSRLLLLASAPTKRARPAPAIVDVGVTEEPMVIAPAFAPDGTYDDPLAPLILRTGFASSYAPIATLTPAQEAAAVLGAGGQRPAAALENARQLRQAPVIQLGVFADPANAARIGETFKRFGRIEASRQARGEATLTIVRLRVLDPAVDPEAVLAATTAAGLRGSYLLAH
jgi:rare lipoprotein A